MRNSLLAALIIVSAIAGPPVEAQLPAAGPVAGTITGTAISETSGQPLAAANVTIRRMADSTLIESVVTDNAGRFTRGALPAGVYLVEIASIGHRPALHRDVRISSETPRHDLGVVRLSAAVLEVEGVTAQGQRAEATFATDRSIYYVRDMPVVQGGLATDALRAVPELEVDVDDNIRARGGEPQIFLDGRPLPMQGAARTAFLQSLRADRIERIEYIPNPSARFEADGQSGIVNIVLRRDTSLGFSGSAAANAGTRGTQGLSTRLNYQIGRVTFFGGGLLNFNQSRTNTFDLRLNRVATPETYLQQSADRSRNGINGGGDVTAELKLTPRSTAWTVIRGNVGGSDEDLFSEFVHMDAARIQTDRYDRENLTDNDNGSVSGALGFRRVVEAQRDEFSAEIRYNLNASDASHDNRRFLFDPNGARLDLPELTHLGTDNEDGLLAFQADMSKPLAAATRVDGGYRGNFRVNSARQKLTSLDGTAWTTLAADDFRYREDSHAAYVTLDHRIGQLGLQGGLRAERLDGLVTASGLDEDVEVTHTGLFPSANLAYDLGGGRQLRLSYSKRIQRPTAFNLNPMSTTATDPLNRNVGNPHLTAADLHQFGLDAAWNGQVGTLRVSPFYMQGTDLWDRIRTVDANGVSTLTPQNIASARVYGFNLNGSVRQVGPMTGFAGLSIQHLEYDAGNLTGVPDGAATLWNANLNVTTTLSSALRVQTTAAYSPGQVSPMGRSSAMRQVNVAVTQRLFADRGTLTLSIVDPFDLSRTTFTTRDQAHEQIARTNNRVRRATLSFSLNFGRPPQSTRRVVQDEGSGGGGLGGGAEAR